MGALKKIRRAKMLTQAGCCYYCSLPMWMTPSMTARRRNAGLVDA